MLPDEQYATQKLLSRFVNIDLDRDTADQAGDYIYSANKKDNPIRVPDAIIAATAIRHHLTLVTFNLADFEHVPGLSLYPL